MSRNKILKSQPAFDVTTDFPDLGLHRAAATGDVGLATYALSHGQPVNSVLDGVLPLHAACSVGNEPVVQLLIDHGADVNAPQLPRRFAEKSRGSSSSSGAPVVGGEGATPLHFAAANGHLHIARLLLKCGARADRVDKHGTTPDMLAAAGPHPETAALLRAWMHGQDADLRFRAESIGTSSNKGGAYASRGYSFGSSSCETPASQDPSGSSSKKLHVRASVERLFRHNPASSSSSAAVTPSGEPGYPEGFDPNARRPSLPHTQPSSSGRRPRSAGTGASNQQDPYNTMTASNGPSTPASKPRTKRSLLSLLRKTSDEPSSPGHGPSSGPGSSPPVSKTGFFGGTERRLSGASSTSIPMATPPPPPRAPLPTALEMHHALTRNRSGSGASSIEAAPPPPGRRAHGRAGSMSETSTHNSGRGWARTLSPARGLKGSGSVTSLRGIDERAVLNVDADDVSPGSNSSRPAGGRGRGQGEGVGIEEETEESDEEEDEYGMPLSHKDRIFAPSSLGREIDTSLEIEDQDPEVEAPSPLDAPVRPFADGRERGGSVSSAATAGTSKSTSSSNVAASTVATSVGSPGYASTMSLFPGTTAPFTAVADGTSAPAPPPQRRAFGSAGSALGLGIDLSTISSPEEATAAVQRAQASILALSTAPEGTTQAQQDEELSSPVLDVEGLTLSPLSARLAAYGETLAMERRLKTQSNVNTDAQGLERRGSLDRQPSERRSGETQERTMIKKALKMGGPGPSTGGGKRPKRPHTANAETRAWEGAEGTMRGPSRLGAFSSSSSGDSTTRFGRSISDQPTQGRIHASPRPSPLDLGRAPLTEPAAPTVTSEKKRTNIQEVELQDSKGLPLQTPAIVETCATPVLGHGFPSPRTAQPPTHNQLSQPLSPRTRVPSAPGPPGAPRNAPTAARAASHTVRYLPPQDTASDSGMEDDPRLGLTPRVDIEPASGASDFDSNASNASTRSSLDVPPYSKNTPLSASASKQSFGFGTQLSRVTTSPGALSGGGSASTPALAQNVKSATKLARMGFGGGGSAGSSGPGTPRAVVGGTTKELGGQQGREPKKFGLRSLVAGLKGRS